MPRSSSHPGIHAAFYFTIGRLCSRLFPISAAAGTESLPCALGRAPTRYQGSVPSSGLYRRVVWRDYNSVTCLLFTARILILRAYSFLALPILIGPPAAAFLLFFRLYGSSIDNGQYKSGRPALNPESREPATAAFDGGVRIRYTPFGAVASIKDSPGCGLQVSFFLFFPCVYVMSDVDGSAKVVLATSGVSVV